MIGIEVSLDELEHVTDVKTFMIGRLNISREHESESFKVADFV
jgi:hypothetical protein